MSKKEVGKLSKLQIHLISVLENVKEKSVRLSKFEKMMFSFVAVFIFVVLASLMVSGILNAYPYTPAGGSIITSGGSVPVNSVVAFNQASCPEGWVLADGTSGTPDLRGIFVRGAGTNGAMQMANGSYFSATYGEYMNDSFQGHYHQVFLGDTELKNNGAFSVGTPYVMPIQGTGGADTIAKTLLTDGTNGEPRNGTETAPASYALIYCVKASADSSSSNTIWQTLSGFVSLVDSSEKLVVKANGVGIESDVVKTGNYTITSDDRGRIIRLSSSATADSIFTLPSASDGEIYRILNDADYKLTVNVSDNSSVWNSGSGYGIDLPDKGTYVELRYSSSANKWDILQKTGGKVLIEGLVLAEPMNNLGIAAVDLRATHGRVADLTGRHTTSTLNNVLFGSADGSSEKFPPGYWGFGGTDEYALVDDSDDWDIFGTNTSGVKTVAFWVYFDDTGTGRTVISQYQDISNYFNLERNTGNQMLLQYVSGGNVYINSAGGTISGTTWTHVAIVIDGSDVGVYIDGNQVVYDGSWGTGTISANLLIGNINGGQFLSGRMQDLHISYNNPYNANPNSGSTDSFTVPAAPFVGVMQ